MIIRAHLSFPLYPGHEGGGIVEEVGSRVHEFKPGDRVILIHDVRTGGLGPGGMAKYFKAKPTDLFLVPDGVDLDLAFIGKTIDFLGLSEVLDGTEIQMVDEEK